MNKPSKIKTNMKMVELGSICKISSGGTPKRKNKSFYGGDIYWAKISDITKSNKILKTTEERITQRGLKDIRNKLFKKGTLFFSMYGSIGKVAFIENQMSCNQAILGINPINNKVDLQYLYYYFIRFQKKLENSTRGVALKNLSATIVKQIQIPLPPLPVQKHIAAILDKADELRQKDQQLIDHYEQLSQSLFLEMFGDPVTNPKGWEKVELGELGIWKSGGTPLRKVKEYYQNGIYPWYSSGELNNTYISNSVERITEEALDNSSAKKIKVGSLLLGMYDTAALKSSITTKVATCNQAIAFSKLDNTVSNTIFIYTYIQIAKEWLRRRQRGVRQKNLNLSMIKGLEINLPPLALQNEFADRVQAIEQQKQQAEKAARYSEELFQSLLQRAFKGELVHEEKVT